MKPAARYTSITRVNRCRDWLWLQGGHAVLHFEGRSPVNQLWLVHGIHLGFSDSWWMLLQLCVQNGIEQINSQWMVYPKQMHTLFYRRMGATSCDDLTLDKYQRNRATRYRTIPGYHTGPWKKLPDFLSFFFKLHWHSTRIAKIAREQGRSTPNFTSRIIAKISQLTAWRHDRPRLISI